VVVLNCCNGSLLPKVRSKQTNGLSPAGKDCLKERERCAASASILRHHACICYRLYKIHADAEDVLVMVFAKVFKHLHHKLKVNGVGLENNGDYSY